MVHCRALCAVGLFGVTTMLLSGCDGKTYNHTDYTPPSPSEPDLVISRLDQPPFAFSMKTKPGGGLASSESLRMTIDGRTCIVAESDFHANNDDYLLLGFEAVPNDCEIRRTPGNGQHGHYRTIDDARAVIGKDLEMVQVDTALGRADVFTQSYYQCTNSCHTYSEPVAIIALMTPTDTRYPSLVMYSPRGMISTDQLIGYLKLINSLQ
jgi:hypothetical protein